MRIKRITIKNFRSYYDTTVFDINEGLTLIIGDNGDGKTTFFDAIEWLFDTKTILPKADLKMISEKKLSQMIPGDTEQVSVSMDFEHDGDNTLERSFYFTLSSDGQISTSNLEYVLYTTDGIERRTEKGENFERIFDTAIRKYSLFKGESELNIFSDSNAVNLLVDTFSELKNFDPYMEFAEYAEKSSQRALDNALNLDKRNNKKIKELRSALDLVKESIHNHRQELRQKQNEIANFTQLLEDLETNQEVAQQVKDLKDRIKSLVEARDKYRFSLRENFTIRLLDEMWILCGFEPIAREYAQKINDLRQRKEKMENRFQQELGMTGFIKQMQKDKPEEATRLPINVPDENTMREMLKDHKCKVCGTDAPEGSAPYEFMKKRLEEYLKSLQLGNEEYSEKKLFSKKFIDELVDRYIVLHTRMAYLTRLPKVICDDIAFINARKKDIQRIESNIETAEEDKRKILANVPSLNEDQLTDTLLNISNWFKQQNEAQDRASKLEGTLKEEEEKERELQEKYDKLSLISASSSLVNTTQAIRKIKEAFANARKMNKRNFLNSLEKIANDYLKDLNIEDFTGIIKLIELPTESVKVELRDSHGKIIYKPNTALKTTEFMAILFAVSELTTIKRNNNYPLIFDAPTSSFAGAKETEFFKVISNVNKQTIIVTKSFLYETPEGRNELDRAKLETIKGTIYRISKARPFNNQDLSTIQTIVQKIK